MSFATLNEAGKAGFIEIKLLDASISPADYNRWFVKICKAKKKGEADGCSGPLSLSNGSLSNDVYIVVPTTFIPNNKGFDIILTDYSGNTIDYLSVGYSPQQDNSCALAYDWDTAIANSHVYRRKPDGTGDWDTPGSGNSGGNTGGGSNEGDSGRYLTVEDASAFQGDIITFIVSLSLADANNDVTFHYETIDNIALAGTHYTNTTGTGTITAGSLNTTISINTVDLGDSTTRDFDLFIDSSTNAGIRDHFANGEIIPQTITPPSCDAVFPNGIQSHTDGGILQFNNNSSIYNNSTNILATTENIVKIGGLNTCDLTNNDCVKSGSAASFVSYDNFPIGGDSIVMGWQEVRTITPNNYSSISLASENTLILESGDYKVSGDVLITNASTIEVVNGGSARFFVKGTITFGDNTLLNTASDAGDFLLFSKNSMTVTSNSTIEAFMYSDGDITLNNGTRINGAVTANNVLLVSESHVYFENTIPDFGGFCDVGPIIDHFQIDTRDAQGITCEADDIIIKACADSACTNLNTDPFSVELFVTAGGSTTSKGTINFSGGSGSSSYAHTDVGNVTLSLDYTYKCINDLATTSCDVDFKDSGFIFSDIPTQLSGKSSFTGFNAETLTLRAVEKNTETGVCQGVFPENTDVAINLSYSCAGGGSCQDLLAFGNNGNSYNLTTTAIAHNLRFDENSTANFTLQYPHAAKFVVNAQKDIEVIDNDGTKEIKNFTGSSNAFVERPFAFFLNFTNDSNGSKAYATTAMGDAFKKAGETFTMTATAVQWVSGQDTNNNGIPDDFSAITGNDTAENFADEELTVNAELLLPDPLLDGNEGTLVTQTTNIFSNSTVNNNYTYSEVGIITLNAAVADGDYLGGGDVVGQVSNVGRFYPDHFVLEKIDGDLAAYCENPDLAGDIPFAYSGQMNSASPITGAIRYKVSLNPSFTITAKSLGSANTTVNYTGDFMKLIGSSITRLAPSFDYAEDGSLGTKLALTANLNNISTLELQNNEESGVITYAYKNEDNFVYHHELNAEINIFTTDINLPIVSVIDPDDVTALDADGDFDNDGDLSNALDSVLTLEPVGVEIRFGRVQLENSYGPETSNLPQPLSVNYFKDGQYIVAEDDECTPYNATEMSLTNIDLINFNASTPLPDITPIAGHFKDETPAGITRAIELTAPGAGNTGQVCVSYAIAPWLQYKWATDPGNLQCPFTSTDVDGLFNDNPFSIATFGIFRGNDRIIYQREIEKIN